MIRRMKGVILAVALGALGVLALSNAASATTAGTTPEPVLESDEGLPFLFPLVPCQRCTPVTTCTTTTVVPTTTTTAAVPTITAPAPPVTIVVPAPDPVVIERTVEVNNVHPVLVPVRVPVAVRATPTFTG